MQVAEPKQRFSPARLLQAVRPRPTAPVVESTAHAKPWGGSVAHRVWIAALALGIFVLDTVTEVDIVVPVLYVNVVLLAMRSERRGDIAIAGWVSVGLTIVSFALTVRPEVPATTALFNTALSLLAILCVTILCLRSVRSQEEAIRTRDRLALVSREIFLKTLSASVVNEVTKPIAECGRNAASACRSLSQSPPDVDETMAAARRIMQDVEQVSDVVGRLRQAMAPRAMAYEICSAQTLIERALEHRRLELGDAGIDVRLVGAPDLNIIADKLLIEQVIGYAISNAIESLRSVEAGERKILVETKAVSDKVHISIEDNGVGFDGAVFDGLFDPFVTAKLGSGLAVGLAASRSIVEVHAGTIRALPHPPRGLIVEIVLPAAGAVRA